MFLSFTVVTDMYAGREIYILHTCNYYQLLVLYQRGPIAKVNMIFIQKTIVFGVRVFLYESNEAPPQPFSQRYEDFSTNNNITQRVAIPYPIYTYYPKPNLITSGM